MKIFTNFLGVTALALIFTAGASADTLELKDGRVLQGKFLGGTRVVVRFEVDGDVQTFRVNEISAVSFDRHSPRDDRRDDATPPPNGPSDAPPPPDQSQPDGAYSNDAPPPDQSRPDDNPPSGQVP
ncbi:MAG: hypothetical protein ABLT11_04770, partial [Candidatus Acidiferrum sp.]